ncbi:MAG: phosphatidylserine decarboxylase [Thermodesulfobacteriota bacterium]
MQSHHEYIDRENRQVRTEALYADRLVNMIYHQGRERMPSLFKVLTSARMSSLLGFLNYDSLLGAHIGSIERFLEKNDIDLSECVDSAQQLDTPRKVFERRIRYWQTRPMPRDKGAIVSPADAKVLFGSLAEDSLLFIKDKFFAFEEMLGCQRQDILESFAGGSFAIFRLTPEKYHYNHVPVDGKAVDFYSLDGAFHSCNPGAIIQMVTPHSKNRRHVTVIDTDVVGGSGAGLVAMVEVVALMIGDVQQCYSPFQYAWPRPMEQGLFLKKGQPKSLFRPGSSTTVLFFQPGRVAFDEDLLANMQRRDVLSRFSRGFDKSLVETDVRVRSSIGRGLPRPAQPISRSTP